MPSLIRFLSRLYPAPWRQRYGEEFAALLDDAPPGWRTSLDVLKGVIEMQIRTWNFVRTVSVATILGALLAYGASLIVPKHYISQAVIRVDASQKEAGDHILSLSQHVLSRVALTRIIVKRRLFESERSRKPIEDVIEQMRENVRLLPIQSTKGELVALGVNYVSDNPIAAQTVNQDLVAGFIDENMRRAPDEGVRLIVIDPSSLPRKVEGARQSWIVSGGVATGLLAGLIFGIVQLSRKPA